MSQRDFINGSSIAIFNYSALCRQYATQQTELAKIQHKPEVIQATKIQRLDSSNHHSKVARSALVINAAAIIIISCSLIFLKKATSTP
uniref:Uncharacterized protein n=1 Tax=Glossina palpalis gambiensis TaxID=67801 RepID=A0A1B0BFB6_9MUSC